MIYFRYNRYLERLGMNNTPMTYDEYVEWDREYSYYEALQELRYKYNSVDKDNIEYPPSEYWESGI